MINRKEDLYGTYIENDNGELRNMYLGKCQEFGLSINDACYTTRSTLIFAKETFDRFGNVDHATVVDFITSKHDVTKKLTLSDLKLEPEVEWKNGDETVISAKSKSKWFVVGTNPVTKTSTICVSDTCELKSFHTVDLKKPESPEEKENRERLEAVEELMEIIKPCIWVRNGFGFIGGTDNEILRGCALKIINKTNYRKTN